MRRTSGLAAVLVAASLVILATCRFATGLAVPGKVVPRGSASSAAVVIDQRTTLATEERRDSSSFSSGRRAFMAAAATFAAAALSDVQPSLAAADSTGGSVPKVTMDEFYTIVKDSARSIRQVEFTGPKSEVVTVRLMDGTTFGIKDVMESPTDPRSPLKISAVCRQNGVPTKFPDLEAALSGAPKRKKVYANQRVLEAAEKEKAKKARIDRDEEQRLEELSELGENSAT